VNEYLESDLGKQHLDSADIRRPAGRREDLRAFIASEVTKWGPIIKAAGIAM